MRDAEKAGRNIYISLVIGVPLVICAVELEEARLENRRLLSVIDRLKETELSLRSQVEKVCISREVGLGWAGLHATEVGGAATG